MMGRGRVGEDIMVVVVLNEDVVGALSSSSL
jgi:hypothetical protein